MTHDRQNRRLGFTLCSNNITTRVMDKLTVPWIYADIMVSQEIDPDQRIRYIIYSKNKW